MTAPEKPKKSFRRIPPDRYRCLELRTWRLLQGLDGDATKLFVYLWCGPHSQRHGILCFPRQYALVDLSWTSEQLARAWATLQEADLLWSDGDLVVIVPFLQSNPPANSDVVTAWQRSLATLPESHLFERLYRRASAWVSEDGLSWLVSKSTTVSAPCPDRVDTGPTLRDQGAGGRDQGEGYRKQEEGVRVQGDAGGEGQGKEPDASAGSASPLEAASLTSAHAGDNSDGVPGLTRASGPCRAGLAPLASAGLTDLIDFLRLGEGREDIRGLALRSGYSLEDVDAALQAVRHAREANGRCQGVSRSGLECVRPAAPGSSYCRAHQAQGLGAEECPI